MADPKQHRERGYSKSGFERGDPESTCRFHLTHARQAAEEARKDGSASNFTLSLSHAKVGLGLAKKMKRPDLEQEAQLATINVLEIAGRRREAMEARIIAAAMLDNLEVNLEVLPNSNERRLVSVGGIPIDEVIRLLEDEQNEQCPSSSGQEQTATTADSHRSDKGEASSASESQEQKDLPQLVLQGRQIRDIHGRLATVLTDAPKLRRKPNFKE